MKNEMSQRDRIKDLRKWIKSASYLIKNLQMILQAAKFEHDYTVSIEINLKLLANPTTLQRVP